MKQQQEEAMEVEAPLVDGDSILVGAPWGLVINPTPLSIMKQGEEVSAQNLLAAAQGGKHCVQCGATATPQWRMHPMGLGALCNACRIWLRPAEALREPVHVHGLPPLAPAMAPEAEKKQKRKRASSWRPRKPSASPNFKPSAEHAGTRREVVVQLRQKKQQHQPPQPAAMQPRTGGDELPTAEPIPLDQVLPDATDGTPETPRIVYGVGGELQLADPSLLDDDDFLFNGPSAPMLIDDEELGLAD